MIYLLGDVHGDEKVLKQFFKRATNVTTLICLGDFGANYFMNERDSYFKKHLAKYNCVFFVIRGNHEERPSVCMEKNPDKWHIEKAFGNKVYVEDEYPYIKYALDYPAVYTIMGYKTLVFPGAYSIDKEFRLRNGWSWFEGEQLSPAEMLMGIDLCYQHKEVDLVLSHTCPLSLEPRDLFLPGVDQSSVDKSMEHYLQDIMNDMITYTVWAWGHYHDTRDCSMEGEATREVMLWKEGVTLANLMDLNAPVQFI